MQNGPTWRALFGYKVLGINSKTMLSVTSFLDYKVSIHPGKETSIICGASSRLRATAAKGGLLFTGLFKDGIAPRASISKNLKKTKTRTVKQMNAIKTNVNH